MESNKECCICYTTFGQQEDGSFICKDGKDNSSFAETCKHYICVPCCQTLYNNIKQKVENENEDANCACPLCREDWTEWILAHYQDDSDEEDSDSDEE
jgi:hypothetical protein